jgi:hypothetical protein
VTGHRDEVTTLHPLDVGLHRHSLGFDGVLLGDREWRHLAHRHRKNLVLLHALSSRDLSFAIRSVALRKHRFSVIGYPFPAEICEGGQPRRVRLTDNATSAPSRGVVILVALNAHWCCGALATAEGSPRKAARMPKMTTSAFTPGRSRLLPEAPSSREQSTLTPWRAG